MSGGHFDYDQYKIGYMADSIESLIEKNGRKKTMEELKDENWRGSDWYEKYPEDLCHYKYPDEVIEEFKKGVELLKLAQIYAHRIDWLVSGDDGNESFLKRLKEDLNKNKL
jgi:predicted house-cleaning noncanonical NTP pyrophosphatase (MazG superfamily)